MLTVKPKTTLPETNADPENQWLEEDISFGMAYLQGVVLVLECGYNFMRSFFSHESGWIKSHQLGCRGDAVWFGGNLGSQNLGVIVLLVRKQIKR